MLKSYMSYQPPDPRRIESASLSSGSAQSIEARKQQEQRRREECAKAQAAGRPIMFPSIGSSHSQSYRVQSIRKGLRGFI